MAVAPTIKKKSSGKSGWPPQSVYMRFVLSRHLVRLTQQIKFEIDKLIFKL